MNDMSRSTSPARHAAPKSARRSTVITSAACVLAEASIRSHLPGERRVQVGGLIGATGVGEHMTQPGPPFEIGHGKFPYTTDRLSGVRDERGRRVQRRGEHALVELVLGRPPIAQNETVV